MLPITPGEIRFRSPACTAGYTEATPGANDAFADGWFHTGDNDFLDDHGRLHVTGRKHFAVEVAGHKVYLPEIEQGLAAAPGVREIALTPVALDGTTTLKAHIVPAPDFSEQSFHAFTQQSLPHHKRPHTLNPRRPSPHPLGKLARDQLTQPPDVGQASCLPPNPLGRRPHVSAGSSLAEKGNGKGVAEKGS